MMPIFLKMQTFLHSSILAWRSPWTSLVGYSPWGHKELDTTKCLTFTFFPKGAMLAVLLVMNLTLMKFSFA